MGPKKNRHTRTDILSVSPRSQKNHVDLSRTIRLSGLSPGAKLELVQLSRSPSVVSVALQLPESEAHGVPNGRLTDKVPSTTTLWLILRKFESGNPGPGGVARNFTARGMPKADSGSTGAGRLYHEKPVFQIMGRELSSFTDLQKTLGQLGFNSGSALLRLSFLISETPLEEAMEQMGQYFKSTEAGDDNGIPPSTSTVALKPSQPKISKEIQTLETPEESSQVSEDVSSDTQSTAVSANTIPSTTQSEPSTNSVPASTLDGPGSRPITVYAPPTSSTPHAARQSHNPSDYEPTFEHAQIHQSRLSISTRNTRLPTEAEISAQREAESQKIAAIKAVEIKIRFPDQTSVVSKFTSDDTAATLYTVVKDMMLSQASVEPFSLTFSSSRGPRVVPKGSPQKLIGQLGMTGRVMVTFVWDGTAGAEVRLGPVLKEEVREKARTMEVRMVEGGGENDREEGGSGEKGKGKDTEKGQGSERKKSGATPKWLKLPGKK